MKTEIRKEKGSNLKNVHLILKSWSLTSRLKVNKITIQRNEKEKEHWTEIKSEA